MKILNINSYYYSSTVHRQLQKALQAIGIDTLSSWSYQQKKELADYGKNGRVSEE